MTQRPIRLPGSSTPDVLLNYGQPGYTQGVQPGQQQQPGQPQGVQPGGQQQQPGQPQASGSPQEQAMGNWINRSLNGPGEQPMNTGANPYAVVHMNQYLGGLR